jgi:hypothetical protein
VKILRIILLGFSPILLKDSNPETKIGKNTLSRENFRPNQSAKMRLCVSEINSSRTDMPILKQKTATCPEYSDSGSSEKLKKLLNEMIIPTYGKAIIPEFMKRIMRFRLWRI